MELKTVLAEDQIIYSLKSETKEALFMELLDVLSRKGKITDRNMALQSILQREETLSTGMEDGLAIPHAKTTAVDELLVAFGMHHKGIEYETLDGKVVHYIFLVLSPPDTSGPHIKALAAIARCIKNNGLTDALWKCTSKQDIHKILTQ
jgi:fructose-specific phosphotransferase system IIA component